MLFLPARYLFHSTIEGTGLDENRDQATQMFVVGRGVEVTVLVHEPFERAEEFQAPPGDARAGVALAGYVDVDC